MRKLSLKFALLVAIIMVIIMPFAVQAETVKVDLNGENLYTSVEPQIVDGRTLVPVRDIFNAVGAGVEWNPQTREITASNGTTTVKMVVGQRSLTVNGANQAIDISPLIIQDRTYAPARYAAEAFGYDVDWDNDSKTVILSGKELQGLCVNYISVGQGDSELISCNGVNLLIDAGENDKGEVVRDYLKNKGITRLDYVIATHPHADHIGGMADIINSYPITNFIMPKVSTTTATFENMLTALSNKGIKPIEARVGTSYDIGGATLTILGPTVIDEDELNNCSVVCRLEYKGHTFIFEGDAEENEENAILETGADISSEVLKVGHHGSRTSTTIAYLNAVAPKYAVISVGTGNSYGHPTEQTLSRLNSVGAAILRTDYEGNIIFRTDGIGYAVTTTVAHSYISAEAAKSSSSTSNTSDSKNSGSSNNNSASEYVLNINTKKIHYPTCSSVGKMLEKNKQSYSGSISELLNQGYTACKICNPS